MFWDRFYNLCVENRITPNAFAKTVNVSSGVITKWKQGSLPNTEALIKISDYFNVSTDYLLTGKEKSSSSELELTENEQRILEIFKRLSESQQGQIIGRAELMAEYSLPANTQSNKQYPTRIAAYGGGNIETTHTEDQLARAIKATEELKKKRK